MGMQDLTLNQKIKAYKASTRCVVDGRKTMEASTIAIEAGGKIFVSKKPLPVDQFWFIAKNVNDSRPVPTVVNFSHAWKQAKVLGCSYSDDIMRHVNDMSKNLHVQSCTME